MDVTESAGEEQLNVPGWDGSPPAAEGERTAPAALPPIPFERLRWAPQKTARGGRFEPSVGVVAPTPWGLSRKSQAPGRSRARSLVREVVETSMLALLVFLAVRASFQNYRVEGHSMDPTLQNGEFLLVNRLVYSEINVARLSTFIPFIDARGQTQRSVFHGPQRGDIIVLKDPRDTANQRLVKRVIGLPGDTLEVVDGHVYINGRLLIEPYITQPWHGSTPKITIPAGDYFVMGDNRDASWDSRYFGLLPRDLIIGKAALSYWPLSKFGEPAHASPTLADAVTRP